MNKKISMILMFFVLFTFIPKSSFATEAPTYRALLIGNSNYQISQKLLGPPNDVLKIENALRHNYFGKDNITFSTITIKQDLTKDDMIKNIRETFKDAKEGDVSYLYYSGHGAYDSSTNTSYLMGIDECGLSVHELEMELRNIPGTIIILLDSCNSGGFINKSTKSFSENSYAEDEYIYKYNQNILDSFTNLKSRSYLTDTKYKVISSASKNQYSYEDNSSEDRKWGGEFTRAFALGNGYNGIFLADKNNDGEVTLQEIYYYTKNNVKLSNVQVYPIGDNYIIGSAIKTSPSENLIIWNAFYDVPLNKSWNIKFNMELDDDEWRDKIYILDSNKNKFPSTVSKNSDEQSISILPLKNYEYSTQYTLIIEDNIYSKNGLKLKNKIVAPFFTIEGTIDYESICLDFVQNSHFSNHPYPTILEAFNSFFYKPTWKYFYSYDNTHIVEFNGIAYKNGIPVNITVQFTVDLSNQNFDVNYAGFDNEPMTIEDFESLLNAIYNNYNNPKINIDIDEIFSNNRNSILLDNYIERLS